MATTGRYDNNIGPILGSAQEGFDAPYKRVRGKANAELDESLAGRPPAAVPRDDTELKNPDDEYAVPAHNLQRPRKDERQPAKDPEGRQGGYPPTANRPDRT